MGRPAQAGRPFVRYNGDMDAAAELLQRADTAFALPRLGGMARPNGVVIVSERRWAFAGVDGSLREGTMPQPPEILQRLPLARGLVRLWASLAPVLRPGGVAPSRERWLILGAVLAPLGLAFVGGRWSTAGGIALSLLLLLTIFRGRALHLHGAEHRAIAAAEERRLVATWHEAARPGDGPLLVCHPGGPGFDASELHGLGGLDRTRTLLLVDPRGSGPTGAADSYLLDDYVADLEELRADLALETIDLLGFSHGGLVAAAYAAAYPQHVRKLVLACSLAAVTEEMEQEARVAIDGRAGQPWPAAATAALAREEAGDHE